MGIRVKLSEIIDGLESQSDESASFLNIKTGEVVLMTDYAMQAAEENEPLEDVPDWERDLVAIAREILADTGEYIQLPTKYDIDEYSMMENFCTSLNKQEQPMCWSTMLVLVGTDIFPICLGKLQKRCFRLTSMQLRT